MSLPALAKLNVLNYAVGPVENEDLFLHIREGVEAMWYFVMQIWKCCPMS